MNDKKGWMMEKERKFEKIMALLLAGILLGACGEEATTVTEYPVEPAGEPVELSFVMYKGAVEEEVQADADGMETRAATTRAVDIPTGTLFRIYAYKAGSTDLENPSATAEYKVQADGTGTGKLSLYRGEYDLYMLSYNLQNETPVMTEGTRNIEVYNKKDFMYTQLKGLVVSPEHVGATMMLVPLTTPFKRMGAQVQLRVKAKDGTHPVQPTSLKVNSIQVEGLPETLSFPLGGTGWNDAGNYEGAPVTYYNFSGNNGTVTEFCTSTPQVLLPVNGTKELTFTVKLAVGYMDGDVPKTWEDEEGYKVSIQKALLPGMKYVFDFTLTFYGVLKPSDLTLAVTGYTETEVPSDEIGK